MFMCFTKIVKIVVPAGMTALWLSMAAGCGDRQIEWEKHIVEETVVVEGIEEEYTLLFLTDTHVVVSDPEASEQQAENETQRAKMFVNAEGISSAEQFPNWVQYANELQVDAVLLGGDIIDTPSDANLQWLRTQLSQLDMPYLYVNGNHDWTYPWEYLTEVGRETYLPLLEPFMQGNTDIQTLSLEEIMIVGIDDSTNQVSPGVLPEYELLLSQGKPTIVMCHVHFYDRSVIEEGKGLLQLIGGAGFEGNAILLHIVGE